MFYTHRETKEQIQILCFRNFFPFLVKKMFPISFDEELESRMPVFAAYLRLCLYAPYSNFKVMNKDVCR